MGFWRTGGFAMARELGAKGVYASSEAWQPGRCKFNFGKADGVSGKDREK